MILRCPLCAGLSHVGLFGDYLRCNLCGLGFQPNRASTPQLESYRIGRAEFEFPNWNNPLSRLFGWYPCASKHAVLFSPNTIRIMAFQQGYRLVGMRGKFPGTRLFMQWPRGVSMRARLKRMRTTPVTEAEGRLSLGIIAGGNAAEDVIALCSDMAGVAAAFVVVLDTQEAPKAAELARRLNCAVGGRSQVIAHPLSGDFAQQRNQIQQAARTDWVLHLDCDERLDPQAKTRLRALLDEAQVAHWDAVAFTRLNLVGGRPSAFYPDVQYRLLRRSVRFIRPVHEYPDIPCGRASFLSLGPGILHYRDAQEFDQRARFYEAIAEGAGRPDDYRLLRTKMEDYLVGRLGFGQPPGAAYCPPMPSNPCSTPFPKAR